MVPLDAAPAAVRDWLITDPRLTWDTALPTPPEAPEPAKAPPKRRGRPRKPTHKTPVDIAEFDSVAAIIKGIPAEHRPAVRERARQLAGQDARLSRGPLVLLNRLIDADWATGISTKSIAKLADECGVDRRTITRAFQSLGGAGHTLRRRKESDQGDLDLSETTLPLAARAWLDIYTRVDAEKSQGWSEKIGGRGEHAPTVRADDAQVVGADNTGRGEKTVARSPAWSDPRLVGWIGTEMDLEMFKTAEVARICEILAESLSDEFLRKLALPLDAALVTDAGLYALRTLVAGVIVARYPTDDSEADATSMTIGAFNRVAEVIYCCSDDGPLASYEQPGTILTDELYLWRLTIPVTQLPDSGADSPELDDERQMLLDLANTVMSSNVPAEKKVAQIRAAIKAAACC